MSSLTERLRAGLGMETSAEAEKPYIYGVTDRRGANLSTQLNDWLINHSGVSGKEKGLFFYSLQMLVNSGVEFTKAIVLLAKRTRNPRFKRILNTVEYDMTHRGLSFSQALAKYPTVFSASTVKMVYSGEMTGRIDETLSSISDQIQKNLTLESQIRSALVYPATVMAALVLAIGVVVTVVVPQFSVLFTQFGSDLPPATRILVSVSDFARNSWWLLGLFLFAGVSLFRNWLKTRRGQLLSGKALLRAPLIQQLVNNIQTVRISSNLGTLLESGVSIDRALQIVAEVMPNAYVQQALFRVRQRVLQGQSLSVSFAHDGIFDDVLPEILSVGERTGEAPTILKKTATQYQREVDAQLKNLTTIIEPIIILIVGGAVVFMALAILSPIFQLQDLFSNAA